MSDATNINQTINNITVQQTANDVIIEQTVNSITVDPTLVEVTASSTINQVTVSSVGIQGPKGDTGADGPSGQSYTFEQQSSSTVWTVNHNLGFRPSVVVQDYGSNTFEGDVRYLSTNALTITFSEAISGYAYLS
jgi:hypothetical protein